MNEGIGTSLQPIKPQESKVGETEKKAPRVFISYSHDSETHAKRVLKLAYNLRRDGVDAMIDQYFLSPPEGWPAWMDGHIRDDDFVIMVCTETYYRRVVRKEAPGIGLGVRWEGSLIYSHLYKSDSSRFVPVLLDGGTFDCIPEAVSGSSHYYVDKKSGYEGLLHRLFNRPTTTMPPIGERPALPVFSKQWTTSPLAALHNTPDLPVNFVARPEDVTPLKALLLSEDGPVGITSSARRAGLFGMGGIGKSVLGAALVRDEEVRKRFPDGIFWLSFGREAIVTQQQAELAKTLGDSSASFERWQEGRSRLNELTSDRSALVVLDDVWQPEFAEAFSRLGPRMGLLITTRNHAVLEKAGARVHRVNLLSKEAARMLLRECTGIGPDAKMPAEGDGIIRECGHLPLAISVIGALIKDGRFTWQQALTRLKAADIKRLQAILPEYEHDSVLAALQVSVEALSERERHAFGQCAVLPEDVAVPEAALLTLWSGIFNDEEDARDTAQLFVNRSLMSQDAARSYRLHDLYHDYLRADCSDLPPVHAAFVKAYRKQCPDGWGSGPDDGYFFRYLPYHLAEAGQHDNLAALLSDYDWIAAKLKATDIQAVLADYVLAANDPELNLVQRALRLSIPALARDWTQLSGQLIGRLREFDEPRICALLKKANAWHGKVWLCPQTASLTPPGSLLQTFEGHTNTVKALAVLPDGRVVSGSSDHTLRLWDLASGESQMLEGHTDTVSELAVLPDGRVVSGSSDHTLRLWDLTSGESRVLEGHTDTVTALAVLPDGRVVSGSDDRTLRLWDLTNGKSLVLEEHTNTVSALAALPDGRVVSGSSDHTLRLWDLASGESQMLEGHTDTVTALAALPDGRVVSGSIDRTLRLWDLTSGESRVLEGHTNKINALAVLPDSRIVSCSGNVLRLWDLTSGESRVLEGHTNTVTALAVLPDGRVVSGSIDRTLRLWDMKSEEYRVLEGHTDTVTALAVLPDGRVVSGSSDHTLRLWDLTSGESRVLEGHTNTVSALAVLSDECVVSCSGNALRLWDLTSGESRVLEGHYYKEEVLNYIGKTQVNFRVFKGHTDTVTALAVLPDGSFVSGSSDHTLLLWHVWDSGDGVSSRVFVGHSDTVTALAVLPDGRFVSGSGDSDLRLWGLASGKSLVLEEHTWEVENEPNLPRTKQAAGPYEEEHAWEVENEPNQVFEGHTDTVTALAVLPDGRVVSGSDDRTMRLWDLTNGKSRVLEGHTDTVTALAVLPDGHIVSCSGNVLRLWDLTSGKSRVLEGHTDTVTALAVLPDGRVVSGSIDGSVIVWDTVHGIRIAGFVGEAAMTCVMVTPTHIIAGSGNGAVHILALREATGMSRLQ